MITREQYWERCSYDERIILLNRSALSEAIPADAMAKETLDQIRAHTLVPAGDKRFARLLALIDDKLRGKQEHDKTGPHKQL